MAITARNSTASTLKDFYDGWDAFDIDSSLTSPTVSGELLSNYPKTSAGVEGVAFSIVCPLSLNKARTFPKVSPTT